MSKTSSYFFIPREGTDYADIFRRVRIMPLYSFPHFKDFNPKITVHKNRFFVHIDFDAFYAQVEQRDSPKLRGKPVSVGGSPDGKGIVMTASYEARALGIDTAMSVWQAKKICPELISVPCYGPKYEDIMENIQDGLKQIVPEDCIEKYSIDECFVDITPVTKNFDDAMKICREIKYSIKRKENLTASVGCSWNKSYAKMATKLEKPDGLTVISPEFQHRLLSLPVKKLWGIGTRIEKRLNVMNIFTVGDLAKADEYRLKKEFGINGVVFRKMARGEDTSEIFRKTVHEKSLNHHHTLSESIYKKDDVIAEIRRIAEYICRKLRSKSLVAGALWFVIRYSNLKYAGGEIKLRSYTNDDREIFAHALEIFKSLPHPNETYKARMFGMTVFSLHQDPMRENLDLFEKKVHLPYYALDKLKYKFGEGIIRVGIAT